MTLINRQTYTATLPDGSLPGIISGTLKLDDSAAPYAQASIVIPTPANPTQLDPRSVGATQPPRVTLVMSQVFEYSPTIDQFSAGYTGKTIDQVSGMFTGKTIDQVSGSVSTVWNTGNVWAGRAQVQRQASLAVVDSESHDDGTTTVTLQSDECYAIEAAGTQLATWGSALTRLVELVKAQLSAIMPLSIETSTDLDLTSAIAASPAQSVYSESAWDTLDTYVQLASARLWCDETRLWHLDPNTSPLVPSTFYSQGFESSTDSFSAGVRSSTFAHSGSWSLKVAASATTSSSRTITGLTVGATYSASVWVYVPAAGAFGASLIFGTAAAGISLPTAGWTQLSCTFVATATSAILSLQIRTLSTAFVAYWDDVFISQLLNVSPAVELTYGETLTSFDDNLSRDSGDWANQVKVIYNWTAGGVQTQQMDFADGSTAGVPPAQLVQTNDNVPYPGSGAAAAILNRTESYGHLATLTAVADLIFNPRQIINVVLPSGSHIGTVSAVTFDFAAKTMAVTTRNLI